MKKYFFIIILLGFLNNLVAQVPVWSRFETRFQSTRNYSNPVYDVKDFKVTFTAPSGRLKSVCGFWDGGFVWKIRFMPDETGTWTWRSECTDKENAGLHNQSGKFDCIPNPSVDPIFRKGTVRHEPGKYYLSHNDGTPFFWLACTAWNSALKSTDEEWDVYLDQRKKNNYNVIQLVTTEWRGCDKSADGLTAIEGTGYIRIHPEFFTRIDKKIDEANANGFVVSPVILWALPTGQGRQLSPGYTLPVDEAVILAKYIVARYQGNHVIWTLGGDGRYYDEQEVKWKQIGSRVFNDIDHSPVTLHPHGKSWVGELFAREDWYEIMGYQSSHSSGESTVNWINQGPMAAMWSKLKPMPYINMEPNYEQINNFTITDKDVRNASYWSILATPVAGVTYGANGIWPWLREGESILNHRDAPGTFTWRKSIELPGSIQMGYLAGFFGKLRWWDLYPANKLLLSQPGTEKYNRWISVAMTPDNELIVAYIPSRGTIRLANPGKFTYAAQWFDPASNSYSKAGTGKGDVIEFSHDSDNDVVLLLKREK